MPVPGAVNWALALVEASIAPNATQTVTISVRTMTSNTGIERTPISNHWSYPPFEPQILDLDQQATDWLYHPSLSAR
jgi:hypothetical protein